MAIEVELVPGFTAPVTASGDLRGHQYKFVQVFPPGVVLANVASAGAARAYVLGNQPDAGQHVTLYTGPSIKKIYAGEAITLGQVVQPMSASGLAGVTSAGNVAGVGTAMQTVAGSGELVPVQLWK